MSTEQTWQTVSTGSDETLKLAEAIGRKLKGGETIELMSDLGGGKTTFVRGLAKGMGSHDHVHSPSFTISNEYKTSELTLYHFDFHRIDEPGVLRDELAEILQRPGSVAAIEWADSVEDLLPAARLTVRITPTSENNRQFVFEYPTRMTYLIPSN